MRIKLLAPGGLVMVAVLDAGVGTGDELGVFDDSVGAVEAAAGGDEDGGAALDAEFAGFGAGGRAGGEPVFAPGRVVAGDIAVCVRDVEQGGAGLCQGGGVPGGEEGDGLVIFDSGLAAADDVGERASAELCGDGGRGLGDGGFQDA